MRHVRGDQQHFAVAQNSLAVIENQFQRARNNPRDLLVHVGVAGHDRAARQKNTRQHRFLAEDHLPRNCGAQFFFLDFVPRCFFRHVLLLLSGLCRFLDLESSNESVAPSMPARNENIAAGLHLCARCVSVARLWPAPCASCEFAGSCACFLSQLSPQHLRRAVPQRTLTFVSRRISPPDKFFTIACRCTSTALRIPPAPLSIPKAPQRPASPSTWSCAWKSSKLPARPPRPVRLASASHMRRRRPTAPAIPMTRTRPQSPTSIRNSRASPSTSHLGPPAKSPMSPA